MNELPTTGLPVLGGVIVLLIQIAKPLLPRVQGDAWLGVAIVLGVLGQVVVGVLLTPGESPVGLVDWIGLVTLGAATGLAAAKAYDEFTKPRGDTPLPPDELSDLARLVVQDLLQSTRSTTIVVDKATDFSDEV